MNEKKELLVIMPAHNEEQNIRKVLEQLEKQKVLQIADILVIDDASSDATGQAAKEHECVLISNILDGVWQLSAVGISICGERAI